MVYVTHRSAGPGWPTRDGTAVDQGSTPLRWLRHLSQEVQPLDTDKHPPNPERSIKFTIDGRPFVVNDPDQTAGRLLQLAGLDPNGYDLGELHGNNPKPKLYQDDDEVRVQNGDRFVSVRECAAVA